MPAKLFAFSALAAALAVSGCSSTGGGGGGGSSGPSPLSYSAVQVNADGAVRRTNGTVEATPNSGTVVVGGTEYNFSGGTYQGNEFGIDAYSYGSGNPSDPNGAAIFVGQYAGAAAVVDNTNGVNSFVVGGEETRRLPNQVANYDGTWAISDFDNDASGTFRAGVDFDNRDIDIDLLNGSGVVGGGSGRVIGTGFNSRLDTGTASGLAGTHTVNGQFYGPNADEMAGLIDGRADNGNNTAGFLIGTQR